MLLDADLAQRLIKSISEASEKSMADGRQAVLIVAPQVRRQLSLLLRHHIDDLFVLILPIAITNRMKSGIRPTSSCRPIREPSNLLEHKTELLYDWEKNNVSNYSLEEIFTNDFYKGYFNNLLKLNPTIIHNEQGGIC